MSGDGDLDGGISGSGGDGVLGACCGALLVLVQRVWSSPPPNSSTMGLWSGLQGWIHCGIWWPRWSGWSIIRAVGQRKLVVLSRHVQRPLTHSGTAGLTGIASGSWSGAGCTGSKVGRRRSWRGNQPLLDTWLELLYHHGPRGKNSPPWKSSCGLSSGSNM